MGKSDWEFFFSDMHTHNSGRSLQYTLSGNLRDAVLSWASFPPVTPGLQICSRRLFTNLFISPTFKQCVSKLCMCDTTLIIPENWKVFFNPEMCLLWLGRAQCALTKVARCKGFPLASRLEAHCVKKQCGLVGLCFRRTHDSRPSSLPSPYGSCSDETRL